MAKPINICDAKTRLSKLLDRAAKGEEIVISRAGKPVARLVPWKPPAATRKPGRLRGRIRIRRDCDAPLPADLFDGKRP